MSLSLPPHNVLSPFHLDTVTASVVRGDLIIGNSTPKWSRLAIGAANTVLISNGTDGSWSASPTLTSLTLAMGTITTALSPLSITETRNAAGVTFPGLVYNVTNTASAAASLYLDIQLAGVSQFKVGANGAVTSLNNYIGNGLRLGVTSSINTGLDINAGSNYIAMATTATSPIFGLSWTAGQNAISGQDLWIVRGGAATLQQGLDVNGAAVSQILQAANGITGTDRTGGNFTFASGKGTGAGAVSSLIFQTPTALASGTTAQSLTTRLTVDVLGIKATGYLSSDGSAGVTAGPFTTITSITVKNGLVTALTGA